MKYIEEMFRKENIDVYINETWPDEPDRKNSNLCIMFGYGDGIDGFTYFRTLCVYDCISFPVSCKEIISKDILSIKEALRETKLKQLLD